LEVKLDRLAELANQKTGVTLSFEVFKDISGSLLEEGFGRR
jgi:hypothetical protein